MRSIGWLVVPLCAAHLAHAQPRGGPRVAPPPPPPNRKPALVSYTPVQLQAFARAVIADKRGDLGTAEDEYEDVIRAEPVANAIWNLADVQLRRELPKDAIEQLEKYIELVEAPADKAAAQKLIERIKAMPPRLSISGAEPGGVFFVDGVKFAKPAPTTIELDPGRYVIDWLGREGYEHTSVRLDAMAFADLRINGNEADVPGGNVIIATVEAFPTGGTWEHKGQSFRMNRRFSLPPGRYDTPAYVPNRACSTIKFDVPRDGLVYVFVNAERETDQNCYPITVTQTVVKP